jgi:hypothetical protein
MRHLPFVSEKLCLLFALCVGAGITLLDRRGSLNYLGFPTYITTNQGKKQTVAQGAKTSMADKHKQS